jgi:hypothetical protein
MRPKLRRLVLISSVLVSVNFVSLETAGAQAAKPDCRARVEKDGRHQIDFRFRCTFDIEDIRVFPSADITGFAARPRLQGGQPEDRRFRCGRPAARVFKCKGLASAGATVHGSFQVREDVCDAEMNLFVGGSTVCPPGDPTTPCAGKGIKFSSADRVPQGC